MKLITALFFSFYMGYSVNAFCGVEVNKIFATEVMNNDDESFTLLTNPVRDGLLRLRLDQISSATIKVSIINSLGNVVYKTTTKSNKQICEYDLSDLAAGIYFLRVQTDNTSLVKKLIIQ